MCTFLVIHTSRCIKIEYHVAAMSSQQDIIGTVANARVQEHHQSGWTIYLISQNVVHLENQEVVQLERMKLLRLASQKNRMIMCQVMKWMKNRIWNQKPIPESQWTLNLPKMLHLPEVREVANL